MTMEINSINIQILIKVLIYAIILSLLAIKYIKLFNAKKLNLVNTIIAIGLIILSFLLPIKFKYLYTARYLISVFTVSSILFYCYRIKGKEQLQKIDYAIICLLVFMVIPLYFAPPILCKIIWYIQVLYIIYVLLLRKKINNNS